MSDEQLRLIFNHLYDIEQYDLVNEILARLEASRPLSPWELLRYGSSKSEVDLTISGAKAGVEYSQKALALLQPELNTTAPGPAILESAFHCLANISGINFWMWKLDPTGRNLDIAIETLDQAISDADRAMEQQIKFPVGRCAAGHLKLLFMLRMRADDRNRPDHEGHRKSALGSSEVSAAAAGSNIDGCPRAFQSSRQRSKSPAFVGGWEPPSSSSSAAGPVRG
jgi:hypothetical protein